MIMGVLCHDPWNKRNLLLIKNMGQTVHIDCQKSRIGKNNLFPALSRRITIKTSLHILQKHFLHIRKLLEKPGSHLCSLSAGADPIFPHIQKCSLNLLLHTVKQIIQQISGIMLRKNCCPRINVKISWKNN